MLLTPRIAVLFPFFRLISVARLFVSSSPLVFLYVADCLLLCKVPLFIVCTFLSLSFVVLSCRMDSLWQCIVCGLVYRPFCLCDGLAVVIVPSNLAFCVDDVSYLPLFIDVPLPVFRL